MLSKRILFMAQTASCSPTAPAVVQLSAPTSSHAVGDKPEVLRCICDPVVNLALWRRSAQQAVVRELSSLRASRLPEVRCETSLATFDEDLCALLAQRDLDPSAFEQWRSDLGLLAELFFQVSAERDVSMRLEGKEDDGCRRFHTDRTHLRLLCTYLGPGTEWLTDAQVDRVAQANGAPNEGIIRRGEAMRFEPFWVGILKGDAFPGNAGRGLVHRSPPVAGTGKTRVLFCLDC